MNEEKLKEKLKEKLEMFFDSLSMLKGDSCADFTKNFDGDFNSPITVSVEGNPNLLVIRLTVPIDNNDCHIWELEYKRYSYISVCGIQVLSQVKKYLKNYNDHANKIKKEK